MNAVTYDTIIVGAGAAGCVLAARLSEDGDRRVLLIEAGPDYPPGSEGREIQDAFPVSMSNPRFSWPGLTADLGIDRGEGAQSVPVPFAQGLGVGGGSNINGMLAYRGVADEYDAWAEAGCPGWGWANVLPFFNRLERDLDFGGPDHGDRGPMPIRRIMPDHWAPFSKAMGEAVLRRGWPLVVDCNADARDGLHPVPMSNLPEGRVSAAMAYLTPKVRARPNLTILADCRVDHLVWQDKKVCGVSVGCRLFEARETILCAGALHSPALMLRSGIGEPEALSALGIDVTASLPGVGQGLRNKPKVEIAAYLPSRLAQASAQRGIAQNCLRFSSGSANCLDHDLGLKFVNRSAWHRLGRHVGAIVVCLYDPKSTGRIALASADPSVPPIVGFGALSDPRDFDRLALAFRLALELLVDPEAARLGYEPFLPSGSLPARLAIWSPSNRIAAWSISAVLKIAPLRKRLMKSFRVDIEGLLRDDESLRALLRARAATGWHVMGSCRMGDRSDPMAVVDPLCRVHGVEGLRVVDASVFPRPVGEGGMHLPVLMLAEKMAEAIRSEACSPWAAEIAPALAMQ